MHAFATLSIIWAHERSFVIYHLDLSRSNCDDESRRNHHDLGFIQSVVH
ncbi:hypothetical protein SLEP1_g44361 [Rubroshorea leprosula]|uniref:Uncharacterized protein n=1 Tax=Rubroshorea leprosula TaxID=152421 RepID=A0AAV5LH75_9ROSI|nr:hypothetical protein SLEP1_g44361 [Rubroshorea leprosula]